jgi:hypothetical protein
MVVVQTAGFAEGEAAFMTLFASLLPSRLPSLTHTNATTTTIWSDDASRHALIVSL